MLRELCRAIASPRRSGSLLICVEDVRASLGLQRWGFLEDANGHRAGVQMFERNRSVCRRARRKKLHSGAAFSVLQRAVPEMTFQDPWHISTTETASTCFNRSITCLSTSVRLAVRNACFAFRLSHDAPGADICFALAASMQDTKHRLCACAVHVRAFLLVMRLLPLFTL